MAVGMAVVVVELATAVMVPVDRDSTLVMVSIVAGRCGRGKLARADLK
jgi:hypothetical protein